MKNIEKLALVVIVLTFLAMVTSPLTLILMSRLYGPIEQAQYRGLIHAMALISHLCHSLVSIGVGIWLFILARRENGTPWIWLLFGLTVGLIAAVLFFLIKTYEATRSANIVEKAQTEG